VFGLALHLALFALFPDFLALLAALGLGLILRLRLDVAALRLYGNVVLLRNSTPLEVRLRLWIRLLLLNGITRAADGHRRLLDLLRLRLLLRLLLLPEIGTIVVLWRLLRLLFLLALYGLAHHRRASAYGLLGLLSLLLHRLPWLVRRRTGVRAGRGTADHD